MIIRDIDDTRYQLLKTRMKVFLTTEEEERNLETAWIILFKDVRERFGLVTVQLWTKRVDGSLVGPGYYIRVPIGGNKIGCKEFSPKVFAKILKAIGPIEKQ